LNVGDVLFAISEAGLTLEASMTNDTLKVFPAENLTPELVAAIKEHKAEIIKIMREDEEIRRTGKIRFESQVFELAHEYFGLDDRGGAR
jgi:TubC N-terminal docking domain